jgi:hypothetical protein
MEQSNAKETQDCSLLHQLNISGKEPEDTMTLVPQTIRLGVSRDYKLDWEVPDALQEIYQNW